MMPFQKNHFKRLAEEQRLLAQTYHKAGLPQQAYVCEAQGRLFEERASEPKYFKKGD